jgi:2-polyprenyl-6-hydroxyphenyl methylase/3-demethylubiquinone-9 3-methyltransferase
MTTPNGAFFRNALPKFSDCPDPSQFEALQFRPNSDGHIFLLWPEEIHAIAERTGLKVEQQMFFTSPLTNGYMKMHYILRFIPRRLVWLAEGICRHLPTSLQHRLLIQTAAILRKPH